MNVESSIEERPATASPVDRGPSPEDLGRKLCGHPNCGMIFVRWYPDLGWRCRWHRPGLPPSQRAIARAADAPVAVADKGTPWKYPLKRPPRNWNDVERLLAWALFEQSHGRMTQTSAQALHSTAAEWRKLSDLKLDHRLVTAALEVAGAAFEWSKLLHDDPAQQQPETTTAEEKVWRAWRTFKRVNGRPDREAAAEDRAAAAATKEETWTRN